MNGGTVSSWSVPSSVALAEASVYNSNAKTFFNAVSNPNANMTTIYAFTGGAIPNTTVFMNCPIGYAIDLFFDNSGRLVGMGELFANNQLKCRVYP